MEKPTIKFQLNRQTSNPLQEMPLQSNDTRESLASSPEPNREPNRTSTRSGIAARLPRLSGFRRIGKIKLLLPILLATVTGVLLGVCLLVLFRGQASEPSVTTVQPNTTPQTITTGKSTTQATAQTAGLSFYTWQVSSMNELSKAQKAQQEFAAQGIHATIRQAGSAYQLLVGVEPDKKSGAALEAVLKKLKINYYAKPYDLPAHQGVIKGMKDQDAKWLTEGLGKELTLASAVMQATEMDKPNAKTVASLKQQLDALQAEEKMWHTSLVQAGLNGEADGLDNAHKQLTSAIDALQTTGNLLNAQSALTGFFVSYEALTAQLIKSN